jgi:hypothetical protein
MPASRQGPAPGEIRKGGNQSAHQSRSTDVQQSRLLPYTTTSPLLEPAHRRAGQKTATSTLESGHQRLSQQDLTIRDDDSAKSDAEIQAEIDALRAKAAVVKAVN